MIKKILLTILLTALIFPIGLRAETQQYFLDGKRATLSTGVLYNPIISGNATTWNATEANRQQIFPTAGTLSLLSVELNGTPGANTAYKFTVRKNSATTTLSVNIQDTATTGADLTNSTSVAKWDTIGYQSVASGTPTARLPRIAMKFTADVANESVLLGGGTANAPSNSVVNYAAVVSQGAYRANERFVQQVVSATGTIKNFIVKLGTAPGAGNSWQIDFMVNSVSMASTTISGTNTTSSWDGTPFNVIPGDKISYMTTPTSLPSNTIMLFGATFIASIDGESLIMGGGITTPALSGANYFQLNSMDGTYDSTEVNSQGSGATTTLRNLYVDEENAAGASKSWTITVRKNAGNATITCNIANPNLTCKDITNSATSTIFGEMNLNIIEGEAAGIPATSTFAWGLTQFIAPTVQAATTTEEVPRKRILATFLKF